MREIILYFQHDPRLLLPSWLFLLSLILFVTMAVDKHRAKQGLWRVPEKRLFLLALLGGAPGGVLGMRAFRHKTKHWTFVWGFPLLALAQFGLLIWLFWKG